MFNRIKLRHSYNGTLLGDTIKYLFSVIIPGILGFSLIPILKSGLGADKYGYYSVLMNGFLIFTSISSSWFTTSIIRYYKYFSESGEFLKKIARLSLVVCIFFSIVALVIFLVFTQSIQIGIVLAIAILVTIFLNISIALNQASFLAHNIILSESVRTILFFSLAIFLLTFSKNDFIVKIFIATIVSNLISIAILIYKWRGKRSFSEDLPAKPSDSKLSVKGILNYGFPIFFWTMLFLLIPYIDKLMVRKTLGPVVQGEYQAIFDLIFKTILTLSNPILTALLPHLANFDETNSRIFNVIKRIILIELSIILILSALYYLFGGQVVLRLLSIDAADNNYLWCGYLSFMAACTWHLGMLLHKVLEIRNRTKQMLYNIIVAFLITIVSLGIVTQFQSPIYLYPICIMVGGLLYVGLCLKLAINK